MRIELASRANDLGLTFNLYWRPASDAVELEATDEHGGACACVVPRERALDAFYHPYIYLGPMAGLPSAQPATS